MSAKVILSIDWDFFIEEDPMLDMAHMESAMFLELLWAAREFSWRSSGRTPEEVMPIRYKPLHFVNRLVSWFDLDSYCAGTAESHLEIVDFLEKRPRTRGLRLYHFDAHHDIYYGKHSKIPFEYPPNCGTWMLHLHRKKWIKDPVIVYPKWRKKFPEHTVEKAIKLIPSARHTFFESLRVPNRPKVEAVFLCRSGCWVPPCYDDAFNVLSKRLTTHTIPPRKGAQAA